MNIDHSIDLDVGLELLKLESDDKRGFTAVPDHWVHIAHRAQELIVPKLNALQPEPVPGAAVRQAVESGAAFIRNQVAGMAIYDSVSERLKDMQAALEQDGLAAAELPSREELAKSLHDACTEQVDTRRWEGLTDGSRKAYYRQADHVLSLLARRPATDVVRPTVCTLEQAESIRTALGPGGSSALTLQAAINAELRPATDEAEAFERGRAEGRSQANGTFRAKLADLESQLAAVTEERDELQGAQVLNRSAIAGLKRERDEALLKAERAQVSCQAAIDDARKACAARDEALAKLAAVEMERDRWEETANCISVDASAKLAARPEPVVIDEALAERVLLDLEQGQAHPGSLSRGYIQVALAALRRAFGGDRASVSVPQGDVEDSPEFRELKRAWDAASAERDQLRADHRMDRATIHAFALALGMVNQPDGQSGYEQASDERLIEEVERLAKEAWSVLPLRAELERAKAYIASMEELGEKQSGIAQSLRAELEKTRAELEACKRDAMASESNQAWGESILKGHYDELLAERDKSIAHFRAFRYATFSGQQVAELIESGGALLKPAPAWQHISSDGDSHTFQHGETGRMTTLEGFATWQEAAQCLDEPAPAEADPNEALRLAVRLAEREVYVPERYRTESAEPIADWVPGWGPKRRTTPEAEPLQHPPPESAMVDADDPDLPESLRTHLNNRAAESAVVEQPCRNPACCPDAPWPKPRIAHDMPSPRTLSPEEMARATAEARELRAKMDLATVGMEDESLPPDRHIERAVAALAERVERLERAR